MSPDPGKEDNAHTEKKRRTGNTNAQGGGGARRLPGGRRAERENKGRQRDTRKLECRREEIAVGGGVPLHRQTMSRGMNVDRMTRGKGGDTSTNEAAWTQMPPLPTQKSRPDDLKNNQKLDKLLITPSTKGVLTGIPGVPEQDDVNISRSDIVNNLDAFNFKSLKDVDLYEKLLQEGFSVISDALAAMDQIFVDTKFEFGYVTERSGEEKLIYMDEVGTPDSSRIWDAARYRDENKVVENSKECFRQMLMKHFPEPEILTNKDRMEERKKLAAENLLPQSKLLDVSKVYMDIAEKITGEKLTLSENPKQEIIDILDKKYGLISRGLKRKAAGA